MVGGYGRAGVVKSKAGGGEWLRVAAVSCGVAGVVVAVVVVSQRRKGEGSV